MAMETATSGIQRSSNRWRNNRKNNVVDPRPILASLERDGFAIVPRVLGPPVVESLLAALRLDIDSEIHSTRDLLWTCPSIAALAACVEIRSLVAAILGDNAIPVRGLLFDKVPEANWKVAWHQDLTIAVERRRDLPGFTAWSTKDGVPHVQPPVEILERMLAVRIHLDDSTADNGPLRVLAGSHRHGRLSADDVETYRRHEIETTCLVPRGGALLMRPLLLHASSAARRPSHRRVIHLEFAGAALPDGLAWRHRSA